MSECIWRDADVVDKREFISTMGLEEMVVFVALLKTLFDQKIVKIS